LKKVESLKSKKDLVVLASIHTHPTKNTFWVQLKGENSAVRVTGASLPYDASEDDTKYSKRFKIPCFQIAPSEGGLFLQRENRQNSRFISPEKELYKGNIDIAKISLDEINKIRQ